jgi:dipeptidyl-peptidase 4
MSPRLKLVLAFLIVLAPLGAQEPTAKPITLDVAVAESWRFRARGFDDVIWLEDGRRFSHTIATPSGPVYVVEDALSGQRRSVFNAEQFAALGAKAGLKGLRLSDLRGATWNRDGLELLRRGTWLRFEMGAEGQLPQLKRRDLFPATAAAHARSASGALVSWVADHDIYVRKRDGSQHRVTHDGFSQLSHGVAVSRVEFGIVDGMWWSPDERRLAFYREDLRTIEEHQLVDWTKRPAARVADRYPMAGRRNSVVTIGVYDARKDQVVWLDTKPEEDEYLTNVAWTPDGTKILVAQVSRSQDHMMMESYDAATGRHLGTLFRAGDAEWIEPQHRPIFLPGDRGDFLWFSNRDGFQHLYHYHAEGNLLRRVTRGDFDVTAFLGFDAKGEGFYFEASGADPRHRHLFHASLAAADVQVGGAAAGQEGATRVKVVAPTMRQLTPGRGQHDVMIAPQTGWILDRWSDLDTPRVVTLRDDKGVEVREVGRAADPYRGWQRAPERFFTCENEAGQTLYGHLTLPPNLDPERKYPVICYVYGGPHSQLVKDEWLGGMGGRTVWFQHLAQKGYIVYRVDGRGTNNRGIDWVQSIHRQLGTVEIADQISGLDHVLGLGFADPERVGVNGWSYGGFMTLSLMTRAGDRFAAGVSGAPVTDWSYYETGYGERYMDTPEENPEGYRLADPGTHVKGLKGRLLLVHGSSDVTVVWQHTMDFLSKCIAKGVDLDYFVYPGQLHGLRGASRNHFLRKMTAFFDRELKPGS